MCADGTFRATWKEPLPQIVPTPNQPEHLKSQALGIWVWGLWFNG